MLPKRDYVVCKIGPNYFAFDLAHIQRIIEARPFKKLGQGQGVVEGLMTLDSLVMPVVNLRKSLGFEGYEAEVKRLLTTLMHELHTPSSDCQGTSRSLEKLSKLISYDDAFRITLEQLKKEAAKFFGCQSTKDSSERAKLLQMIETTLTTLRTQEEEFVRTMQKILIYRDQDFWAALIVDHIEHILALDSSDTIAEEHTPAAAQAVLQIRTIAKHDERLLLVVEGVDVARLKQMGAEI